ncbi:hypothetical protein CLV47_11026 [Antricoccus suffuscus]|uniref:Uncharacterized protein n=2 Tax=Antricoccus suffuscus TaxID=1629062 RepID=A0A2T0ZY71_9ACTN|nr:hypothetical protein CLV47_11026 [Antricoccus suffuscus]
MPDIHRIPALRRGQPWSSRMQIATGLMIATVAVVGGCTSPGSADPGGAHAPSPTSVSADNGVKPNSADTVQKQCSLALTSAADFMPTWKSLANQGTSPSLEQRQALAAEIQMSIDQLADQLAKITDSTLASDIQDLQGEMGNLVSALNAGTGVDLAAYNKAVGTAKEFCDK